MMYALKKEPEERTLKEVEQIMVENISILAAYQFLKMASHLFVLYKSKCSDSKSGWVCGTFWHLDLSCIGVVLWLWFRVGS